MRITKISPQKRKGSFNVFIDGKYAFSLSEEDVVKEKISVGLELSLERLNFLKFKGKFALFLAKILNFLSFRPRSEKEVKDKLKEIAYKDRDLEKDQKTDLVEAVFDKVKNLKFVNDFDFGKWFVEQRREAKKPSGTYKIKTELFKKGLTKELINELLGESLLSDEVLAFKASEKKLKLFKNLPLPDFKHKMSSYLLRQGFSWDVVSPVVDTLLKRQYNKSDLDN